jgi:hypothetical protein
MRRQELLAVPGKRLINGRIARREEFLARPARLIQVAAASAADRPVSAGLIVLTPPFT